MNPDFQLRLLEQEWLGGGSALPVVQFLMARGATFEAAAVARLAISQLPCPDEAALESLLRELADLPEAWEQQLSEFTRSASLEGWRELMRFVPPERLYERQKYATRTRSILRGRSRLISPLRSVILTDAGFRWSPSTRELT